jgi:hypothetical protein
MCAVEVNASPDTAFVVLSVSRRIKGHISERKHTVGMVGNRQKYFAPDAFDGAAPRLLNTIP